MSKTVKSIPEAYHSVTPYLYIRGAAEAIEFYQQAFGASEVVRLTSPDGRIGHAEIQIGDSRVMLADEIPEMNVKSPHTLQGTSSGYLIYVDDADEQFARALTAGGVEVRPVQDQFYGDRSGTLADPFGHVWTIATHVEDVPPEEIDRRFAAMTSQAGGE